MLVGVHRTLLHKKTAAAVVTTTFDPVNIGGTQSLSSGNLKVTGSGGNGIARSLASHTTGKYYCEVSVTTATNSIIGVIDSGETLSGGWVGDNFATAGGGSVPFSGVWFTGASGTAINSPTLTTAHVYALAIDITNRAAWIKDLTGGGNWNVNASANPATNVGGQSWSAGTGTYYAAATCSGAGDNMTFNFGATAYVGAPPSGFGNW